MDIGIVGCGQLGRTLAQGLSTHPRVSRIVATTRSQRTSFPGLPDVIGLPDNGQLAAVSDVIILCLKPAQMEAAVREMAGAIREDSLIISAAAGISTDAIANWTGGDHPVVRAMPNMPCRIGAGMTALARGKHATEASLETARVLFLPLGRVTVVEERLMDAVTAISGCGPAYVYLIIEALAESGVKLGMPRATALELAAQTLQGAAALVLQSDTHPAALKDEVTTPAGCTIDALMELEDGKLRSTLLRAVTAAARKSAELASG